MQKQTPPEATKAVYPILRQIVNLIPSNCWISQSANWKLGLYHIRRNPCNGEFSPVAHPAQSLAPLMRHAQRSRPTKIGTIERRPEKARLKRSGNSRSVAKAYAEAMRKTAKSRASRRTERDEKKLEEM